MNIIKQILTVAFLLTGIITYAQTPAIEFAYDAAGNRIQRKVVVLTPKDSAVVSEEPDSIIDKSVNYTYKLFPNPTAGQLRIELSNTFMELSNKQVQVLDMSGKLLESNAIQDPLFDVTMDQYSVGSYIVRVIAENKEKVKEQKEWRVVKQ